MVAGSKLRTEPAPAHPGAASPGSNGSGGDAVQAVILAGGHSWGENPLEQVVCRPLVPVAGHPLLVHTLNWLRGGGITRVNICVNHEARQIRRLLGDGADLGVELEYFEDVMPRGPAGCVRDVASQSEARRFLVVEGTILPRLDLHDLLAAAQSVLTVVATPARGGMGGKERSFVPAGIYVFSRAAFAHIPETGFQDIKETLIPRLHAGGERVDTFVVDGRSVSSVNGLGSYLGVSHQTLEQMTQQPPQDGYVRVDDALIHRTARVDASVRLVGPVMVGPHADLVGECVVVGPTTIGARTRIGAGSVVCRSVLWSDCVVEPRAVVDQCIVTSHSVVCVDRDIRHSVVVPARRGSSRRQPQIVETAGARESRITQAPALLTPAMAAEPIALEPAGRNGERTLGLAVPRRAGADVQTSSIQA